MQGSDNRNKTTDIRKKGTDNRTKGTDNRNKGTDNRCGRNRAGLRWVRRASRPPTARRTYQNGVHTLRQARCGPGADVAAVSPVSPGADVRRG